MKENDFDIYVRNLMAGAEEPVPTKVWKGVEDGLAKAAPKRTVPLWLWRGIAGVAVAAAAVTGIILLTPDKHLSNQPTIQQPVAQATDALLPAETRPEEDVVPSIGEQVRDLGRRSAYVPEIPVIEDIVPAPVEAEPAVTETGHRPDAILIPDHRKEAVTSDEDAFNRLAFEERNTRRKGHFSLNLLGNLQTNTRPQSPTSTVRRTSGLFLAPAPVQTGLYSERPEFSFEIPVSAGLSFRYDFNQRWGIGTGIVYTYLSRSFLSNYAEVENGIVQKNLFDTDVTNQQHYLGIPLNLYFNIVNTGNWNVHARLGGMAEKLIDNHFLVHDSEGDIHFSQKVDPLQYSAGIGLGVEFKFTPNLGIYFDPTIRYYFDCGQPRSIRTIQPLRMDFEAGLRFSLD